MAASDALNRSKSLLTIASDKFANWFRKAERAICK